MMKCDYRRHLKVRYARVAIYIVFILFILSWSFFIVMKSDPIKDIDQQISTDIFRTANFLLDIKEFRDKRERTVNHLQPHN
jgi:hypothetical protein